MSRKPLSKSMRRTKRMRSFCVEEEEETALARRAFDVLEGRFRDRENGGYFWRTAADGRPPG